MKTAKNDVLFCFTLFCMLLSNCVFAAKIEVIREAEKPSATEVNQPVIRRDDPRVEAAGKEVLPQSVVLSYAVLPEIDIFLSATLDRWCKQSAGECGLVKFEANDDVRLEFKGDFGTNFKSALDILFGSLNNKDMQIEYTPSRFRHKLTSNGVLLVWTENN